MKASTRVRWIAIALLLAAASSGIGFVLAQTPLPAESSISTSIEPLNGNKVFETSSGERYVVDPAMIVPAGPGKDGIPSIDDPQFESAAAADAWLSSDTLVVALVYKGQVRAYPLPILEWHEIVNDVVAGDPLLVTYCPLCSCAAVYRRMLDGAAVQFGTSGMLYNSNLVMYDRSTQSYWSQIDGLAIEGPLTGEQLESVDVDVVFWGDWKAEHPDTQVLSRDTGFDRDYGHDPYSSYYAGDIVCFPLTAVDSRVSPQTVVFGIDVDGTYTAYREDDLARRGVIDDRVGGTPIRITRDASGAVRVENRTTGTEIAKVRAFWFAWYAFHPTTTLDASSNP